MAFRKRAAAVVNELHCGQKIFKAIAVGHIARQAGENGPFRIRAEKPCSRHISRVQQAMSEQQDKRLPSIRHGGNALQEVARLFLGLGCGCAPAFRRLPAA